MPVSTPMTTAHRAGLSARRVGRVLFGTLLALPMLAWAAAAEMAEAPAKPGEAIRLPSGFRLQVFAQLKSAGSDYFRGARFMTVGPDGHLYLSMGTDNKVVMLPDRNHDGVADEVVTVADKLNAPQGLAFAGNSLLVANQDGVVRLEQKDGRWPASAVTPLISGLAIGGHTMKTLRIGPDGFLYLNVGSSCNVCDEADASRATIHRYTLQGKPAGALKTLGRHAQSAVWASGLRNSQGLAWQAATGDLYATNNGADMRSDKKGGAVNDKLPPEHLNRIIAGSQYGWPHCWGMAASGGKGQFSDPNFPGSDGFCQEAQPPAITFDSHSTPLGITFLDQAHVPKAWRDDAIVALHGSWNREQPSGYKLVRVEFQRNKPVAVSDFATGWLSGKNAWGRPVDVVVGSDKALYVSDDRAGMVYRISYDAND